MPSLEPTVYVLSSSDSSFQRVSPRLRQKRQLPQTKSVRAKGEPKESSLGIWLVLAGAATLCAVMILGAVLFMSHRREEARRAGEMQAWNVVDSVLTQLKRTQHELTSVESMHSSTARALADERQRAMNLDEDIQELRRRHSGLVAESHAELQKWSVYGSTIKQRLDAEASQRQLENAEAAQTTAQLKREGDELARENETMLQRNERLLAEAMEYQRAVLSLRSDRDSLVSENGRLRSSEASLLSDRSRLESSNSSLQSEVSRLESCVSDLRSRICALERECEHHKSHDRRP